MPAGRRAAAASLLAIAGLSGCQAATLSGPRTGGPMPRLVEPGVDAPSATPIVAPAREAADVSVLSFNMHHRDRARELAVMADYLRDGDLPDFILCQEVLFGRGAWQGHENTAAVLADELGYHWRGTRRRENREGVAIVSRYPFEHYQARHLEARTSSLLMGFRRVSAMGEFRVPGIGLVRVVTTHLAYQPWEGRVRRRQLEETLAWIGARERVRPAAMTILGGDFNAGRGSRELQGLFDPDRCGGLRFTDHNTDEPSLGHPLRPSKRVDYVFVATSGRDVRGARESLLFRDGLWHRDGSSRFRLSDHLPVLHEYELDPAVVAGR